MAVNEYGKIHKSKMRDKDKNKQGGSGKIGSGGKKAVNMFSNLWLKVIPIVLCLFIVSLFWTGKLTIGGVLDEFRKVISFSRDFGDKSEEFMEKNKSKLDKQVDSINTNGIITDDKHNESKNDGNKKEDNVNKEE